MKTLVLNTSFILEITLGSSEGRIPLIPRQHGTPLETQNQCVE